MLNRLKNSSTCKSFFSGFGSYLLIGIFSGLIGAMVSFPFLLINAAVIVSELLKGAGIGFLIGIVSRIVFEFVFKFIHTNPVWAFCSVFIIIGAGTLFGSYFMGMIIPAQLIIITLIAEAIGISLCVFLYNYSKKLNEKLKEKQKLINDE